MLLFFQYYMIPIWYHTFNHLFYVFKWTVQCQLGMEVLEKCLEVSAFGVKAASLSQDSATSCACHGMSSDIMSCPNGRRHEMIAQYVLRTPVCLYYSIVSSAFAVLNIRSEACTKFNCTRILKLMCIPCTVQICTVICCIRFFCNQSHHHWLKQILVITFASLTLIFPSANTNHHATIK